MKKYVKEEESQDFIKYQEFPQGFNTIEYFIGLEKAVFQKLLIKTQDFVRQIKIEQKTLGEKGKKQAKNYLFDYLNKIKQTYFSLQNKVFHNAFEVFKKLFQDQIDSIWSDMSESQRDQYNKIGENNYQIVRNKYKHKWVVDKFSGYQMFKIDILCIIFLCNKQYLPLFNNHKGALLSYKLLSRLLDIDKSKIILMRNKYMQSNQRICYDYKQCFQKYIQLLYVISLAYKLVIYAKRNGKITYQNIPIPQVSLNVNQQDEDDGSNNVKFKFCEIVFTQSKKKHCKPLMKIAQQQKLPQQLLIALCNQFEINQSSQANIYLLKCELLLQKCQWVFLKGSYSLIQGINTVLGDKILTEYNVYWSKRRLKILSILCRLAMERFSLLSKVYQMHQKLQPNKESIFIYKFQYSLRDIINTSNSGSIKIEQKQMPNYKCTLVLFAVKNQIIAYTVYRNGFNNYIYLTLIKLCLQQIIANIKQFNLVIYDFDYQKSIELDIFFQFQIAIKIKYRAKVYMINDPNFFQPHFIIDSFIRTVFASFAKFSSTNFHRLVEIFIMKLLYKIEVFERKGPLDSFTYLQKKIKLSISPASIKDLQKCLQNERNNKYKALVLHTRHVQQNSQIQDQLIQYTKASEAQQLLSSIEECSPNYHQFIEFQEGNKWRNTQLSKQQADCLEQNVQLFLKQKHMKERDIKRILKDVAKYLLIYQIYFKNLQNEQQTQAIDQMAFLTAFYEDENKNIDAIYPYPQRQKIINDLAIKLQKRRKTNRKQQQHIPTEHIKFQQE